MPTPVMLACEAIQGLWMARAGVSGVDPDFHFGRDGPFAGVAEPSARWDRDEQRRRFLALQRILRTDSFLASGQELCMTAMG